MKMGYSLHSSPLSFLLAQPEVRMLSKRISPITATVLMGNLWLI